VQATGAYGRQMRASGLLSELPEARPADHVCWVYDEHDAGFDPAVRRFLAGGVARGERLLVVGDRAIAALDGDPAQLDAARLRAEGALELLTVDDAYAATEEFTVERQRAWYEAATHRARDDGYTGLRVVAEMSGLAADPRYGEELVRWEHVADEFMAADGGMSAMCTYRSDLPPASLSAAAAAHPAVRAPEPSVPFRVFFEDGQVVLVGEVDAFDAERLAALLAAGPVGARAVLDVRGLEFVGAAGLRALARWAVALDARGSSLELRGASSLLRRMWCLLGLDDRVSVGFSPA
jgi:anti-anti-sigma regulatory factor